MTLLSICQDAAAEMQLPQLTSIISNTDPFAITFLRLLNRAGTALMRSFPWEKLRNEATFTSVATESQGALTTLAGSDFEYVVPETMWNRTNPYMISGPASAARWQGMIANSYDYPQRYFMFRGGNLLIRPLLSAGDTIAFEWVSQNWAQATGGGATKSSFTVDTDVGVLDEELLTLALVYSYLTSEDMPNGPAGAALLKCFKDLAGNEQARVPILTAADIFAGGRHNHQEPGVAGYGSFI